MKDTVNFSDDTTPRLACQQVVHTLIARYGWTLLPADELVEFVLRSTQPQSLPGNIERLVIYHYTIALYEACQQPEDLNRRERGYTDLFHYLYRVASNRWPDMAEDVVQRALVLIHEQIDRCREPAAFLSFALFKLRHAVQQEQRARDDESLPSSIGSADIEAVPEQSEASVLEQERLQALIGAIRRLPDKRKRQVIMLRFFGALSDEEISASLGIKVGHVRKLRFDALKQLRKDRLLKIYLEQAIDEES